IAKDEDRIADGSERIAKLVREDGEELVLAPVVRAQRFLGSLAIEQVAVDLVLPLARAQRSPGRADERRDARRALENRHVAEELHRAGDRRRVCALVRDDEHRQIRPRGLSLHPLHEKPALVAGQRLLWKKNGAGAGIELTREHVELEKTS